MVEVGRIGGWQGVAAIEARARSELGLIREGETYFQLLEPEDKASE